MSGVKARADFRRAEGRQEREGSSKRSTICFEDLSPVGQSLVRAFEYGVAWTPEFHSAFIKNNSLNQFLTDSAAWRTPSDHDGARDVKARAPTETDSKKDADAKHCTIGGEDLHKILSHTIVEREDAAQAGIQIDGVPAKEKIDELTEHRPIKYDRRGVKAIRLRVIDDDADGIALNCSGLIQPTPIQLIDCIFEGRVLFDSANLGPLSLKEAKILANADEAPNFSAEFAKIQGPLNLDGLQCKGVCLDIVRIGGVLSLEGFSSKIFHILGPPARITESLYVTM